MNDKYKNKYRIASARAPFWHYWWEGAYFVTICTKYRECFFRNIKNGMMTLSRLGEIAENEWLKTPKLRPDMNLELGPFVIMPNHVHGIIIIEKNKYNDRGNQRRGAMHCTSTLETPKNKFGPQSKNLASIIRGFKMAVTANARKIHVSFAW